MDYILYAVKMTVCVMLDAVLLAMLVRAILSFVGVDPDGPVYTFLCVLTEPFIVPIRYLFDIFGLFRNLPVDLSFFVSYLILNIVSTLLAQGL